MHVPAEIMADTGDPTRIPLALLVVGGLGLYVAARVGTHALVGPKGSAGASAGAIAVGHWMPTVAVALTAVLYGRVDVALGVAFATSVAAASLAVGMNVFLVPSEPLPSTRRVWPFLLPAALLVVVAGFGGALNVIHALMLAAVGAAVYGVWRAAGRDEPGAAGERLGAVDPSQHASSTAASPEPPPPPDGGGRVVWPALLWVLAAGLAVVAARAAVVGTVRADAAVPYLRAAVIAAGALSPILVLPLLAVGSDLAQRNRSGEACSACLALALLNQLALVPIILLAWIGGQLWQTGWPDGGYASARAAWYQPVVEWYMMVPSVPLPLSVWRIDAVVLAVLAFALIPAAVGRWRLGRIEALALLAAYAAYLAASAFLGVRTR